MKDIIQPGHSYVSPAFSEDKIRDYRLSIGPALDGFSFLVQDENKNVLMLNAVSFKADKSWEEIVPALKQYLEHFPWMRKVMKSKVALVDTSRFTLLPFSLYENSDKKTYLELNHPVNDDDLVKDDMLKDQYSYVVYAYNEALRNMINLRIPGLFWRHYARDFINCAAKQDVDKYVSADVRNNRFYVVAFADKRIKFCNAFRYASREDFVYFIMLVYKQLGFDPRQVPLKLFGMIEQNSEINKLLDRYVNNVTFGDTTEIYRDEDNAIACYTYQFENLKEAAFCE